MRFAFAVPPAVAIGVSISLAGCGNGGATSTTTTTTTLFDSHVMWFNDAQIPYCFGGCGLSVGAGGTVFWPGVNRSDKLYVDPHFLFAIDGNDGALQWQFELLAELDGLPLVGMDGSIYVQTSNWNGHSAVQAVHSDGTAKWTQDFNMSQHIGHPPSLRVSDGIGRKYLAQASDGTIFTTHEGYYATHNSSLFGLFALSGDSGTVKWHMNPVGNMSELSSPILAPDGTVFMADYTGLIFAVRGDDGSVKWHRKFINGTYGGTPTLGANGTILLCQGGHRGGLIAIDSEDGSTKWIQPAACGGDYSVPAVGSDGTVFVPQLGFKYSGESVLLALTGDNGSIKWSFRINNSVGYLSSAAVSTDGTVYVCGSRSLYALDAESGSMRWNSTSPSFKNAFYGDNSAPVVSPDGTVLIVANDEVVAFHGEGGPVTVPYNTKYAQHAVAV